MKKTRNRKAAPKKRGAPKNVDEYLARVPEPVLARFTKLRAAIQSVMPTEAAETISYGIPAFKNTGVLVWFAAFSKHCSLFPTAAVIKELEKELEGISTSKGTVHFANDKPLPVALVKKLVRARVAQSKSKKL